MPHNWSYCLIGDPAAASQTLSAATPNLSGLWLWSRAFREYGKDGDIRIIWRKEDLEEWDVIHINYTPSNIQLPTIIREELGDSSSTKLIMNVDLDISYHGINWAYWTPIMIKELKMADALFHVESVGARYIKEMIDHKKHVHTLPHPVDVSRLHDFKRVERENFIACIFHRYHPDTITPYIATKDLPLRKHLYNYDDKAGKFAASQGCWDMIIRSTTPMDYINQINKALIGCDLYRGYTFGRTVIEFVALGIPAVCSNTIEAGRYLLPETCVEPLNVKSAKEKLNLLLDNEFASDILIYAHERCGWYGLEQRHQEMIKILETIK